MKQRSRATVLLWGTLLGCLVLCLTLTPLGWAQQSQGTVTVSVVDPTGGVIPGAKLTLVDVGTNDSREASTQDAGNYTFVNLNLGSYKLTVSKDGFESQTHNVVVQAGRITDVKATMKVGSTSQVVEVVGGTAPLVETTSSATNMTIDTKQIEDLPILGRNIAALSRLSAGYNGTWNGLPTIAQGNTIDGIVGNTSRWRYGSGGGADSAGISPRLENIAEMTVSTDQLDLNQGWGTSNMQITYVTRRGSNAWHGRLFEDYRSSALNAHNWRSAVKPKFILNEFGGSIGGPIRKDKLFFFGSFSMSKQPSSITGYNQVFTSAAQGGTFTYFGTCRQGQTCSAAELAVPKTIKIFDLITAYNTANKTTLRASTLSAISSRLGEINNYAKNGFIQAGGTTDPNIQLLYWPQSNPLTYYYPTFRVDYNISQNLRLNLAYNQTKMNSPGANAGWFPGDGRQADNRSNAATASLGLEWTISPTLINQFKAGYLYTAAWFGVNGPQDFRTGTEMSFGYGDYEMSGLYYNLPNSRMQPVISISDNMTWVKGPHTFTFGFNAYRDQNKYWDPPEGYQIFNLGLAEGDPALQAIYKDAFNVGSNIAATDDELWQAQQLYAILAGRVSYVSGRNAYDTKKGSYANDVQFSTLNEVMKSWGLFFQDSYKVKSNLTLNYGLRWDFVSPDKDLTGKYHSMTPADLFGPSGVWNVFNPGSLKGTNDPVFTARETAYNGWNKTPQPAIGLAWTPRASGNILEKLLGGDKTVVRAGYSLRRFTEPQQFVWDVGSSYGLAFYQNFWAQPSTSGDPGTFMPGSVEWGKTFGRNDFQYSPTQYDKVIHLSESTFGGGAAAAMNPNIRQPYTQSWNFGIQRELGPTRALEIRYNGSHTIHQWIAEKINEVNVFENGFLDEFKHAQANLAINGGTSFAPGAAGTYALPIMSAAGVAFTNSTFINNLRNGQVGSFAGSLSNNPDYFCKMVGSSFGPCGSSYGPGAGYPINFFVANPYAIGAWTNALYMDDRGYSNYNGLQMEFRQRQWHGMTMTANYTWSRTLGVQTAGDWMGGYSQVTMRNLKSAYGPVGTDRQQVIHVNATYDLPFGKGRYWLNRSGVLDKIIGGWTVSSIVTWQTGAPFRVTGANYTYNDLNDGGVVLNGITAADLQDHVGVYYNAANQVRYLDPKWTSEMFAKGAITSNTTPGTIGQIIYLHGPRQTYTDIGLAKSASITERFKFKFQTLFINAFNHPVFTYSGRGVGNVTGFGSGALQGSTRPRNIEFRANIEF